MFINGSRNPEAMDSCAGGDREVFLEGGTRFASYSTRGVLPQQMGGGVMMEINGQKGSNTSIEQE